MDSCEEQLSNPNSSLYDDELWEAAKGYCTYLRSSNAALTLRYPYALSAISSMLITYLILISPTKLSSSYHRIVFGLSVADIIYSLASGLTTLPMPSHANYWTDINNIQGTRIGTNWTCSTQGFFIDLGYIAEFAYYTGLHLYYLLTIAFKVDHEKIEVLLEPVIHVVSISLAFFIASPPLLHNDYNAFFALPWCTRIPKPWFCIKGNTNSTNCIEETNVSENPHEMLYIESTYPIFPFLLPIILSLLIICWRVFHKERKIASILKQCRIHQVEYGGKLSRRMSLRHANKSDSYSYIFRVGGSKHGTILHVEGEGDIIIDDLIINNDSQYEETKIIAFQSFLYFAAVIIPVLCWNHFTRMEPSLVSWYKTTLLVASCLTGFFNLWIFLFHKVYNMRRSNRELRTWDIIKQIFRDGGIHDTFVMSRMCLLSTDSEVNGENIANCEIDASDDESCQNLSDQCGYNNDNDTQPLLLNTNINKNLGIFQSYRNSSFSFGASANAGSTFARSSMSLSQFYEDHFDQEDMSLFEKRDTEFI